jgi:hypothetical protein
MPLDSIIFKGYQGDEKELEERIIRFFNLPPYKKVRFMEVWTAGIEVYIMMIFGKAKTQEEALPEGFGYGKLTGNIRDY